MDAGFWVGVSVRWVHVLGAAVLIGGLVALRWNGSAASSTAGVGSKTYRRLVHSAAGLVLLSGIYNYVVVSIPRLGHIQDQVRAGARPAYDAARLAAYHPVLGAKIVLGLALIALVVLLLVPVPSLERRRSAWLSAGAALGAAVLLAGAVLRRLWP